MPPLERGHRADHGLDPVELALVEIVELLAHLPHAGHHPGDRRDIDHVAALALAHARQHGTGEPGYADQHHLHQ